MNGIKVALILGLDKKCTKPGESVPAGDGCNTCICKEDGTLGGCTLVGCIAEISGSADNAILGIHFDDYFYFYQSFKYDAIFYVNSAY